jgi:cobyrinic acid a,c-diamide synthase
VKGLVIGGAASGAGKTTLTLALIAALRRRGLIVQPFKVGPDFIDPGHHALAAGRPAHNLDGWMLGRGESLQIFARHATGADVAVVEGVMGLYDGFDPQGEAGSTAEMAKWLGLPVLLTVGARSAARSLAALAQGFHGFDPGLSWVGLVANQTGGPRHAEILRQAMELVPGLPFLGALPRRPELGLSERHLGLVTAEEGGMSAESLAGLADWLEAAVDVEALLAALPEVALPDPPAPAQGFSGAPVRLGVARDAAFCFYYEENLRRLAEAGAELVFFSPLADPALPPDLAGLYLGGGYPELFAEGLAANARLRGQIAKAGRAGLPIYAECGGMMYLGRTLVDLERRTWPMAGLLPLATRMLPRLRTLGYRAVTFNQDTPLGPAGTSARGHEFHYSEIAELTPAPGFMATAYAVSGREGALADCPALLTANTLASYVHLHFGSNPALAPALVERCRQHRG